MRLAFALAYVTAAALAVRGVTLARDARVAARLGEGLQSARSERPSALSRIGRRAVPAAVRVRAANVSRLDGDDLDRLLGTKVVLGALGAAVGGTAATTPVGRIALASILGAGAFTLPSFRVGRRRAARTKAIRRSVPDALDVVAVGVSAGLTPRLALERVSDAAPDPLASELEALRRDVALGVPWLRALSDVAARTGLEELKRLATTLARSERLGSPVAERLRALARDVRAERRDDAEERARRAPVAMLFPLVFLILPAFVLTAVVPAVLVATRGIQ